jgi:hypothetical protein
LDLGLDNPVDVVEDGWVGAVVKDVVSVAPSLALPVSLTDDFGEEGGSAAPVSIFSMPWSIRA